MSCWWMLPGEEWAEEEIYVGEKMKSTGRRETTYALSRARFSLLSRYRFVLGRCRTVGMRRRLRQSPPFLPARRFFLFFLLILLLRLLLFLLFYRVYQLSQRS